MAAQLTLALLALGLALLCTPCLCNVPNQIYDQLLTKAQEDTKAAFDEFALLHGKPYLNDAEEYSRRHAVFQVNVAKIVAHNAQNDASFTLGLNAHADLTVEEFKLRYFGARPQDLAEIRAIREAEQAAAPNKDDHPKGEKFPYSGETPAPRRNWVDEGRVTPVKDQHVGGAPCGCCYAFGGMAGIEAANSLYTGELTTLSEQEIVDCDELDFGCDGGDFSNVFIWVMKNGGVSSDEDWPYVARETGSCPNKRRRRDKAVTVQGHVDVPRHNETALMQSVTHTPTVVAVCCGDFLDQWHLYKSGIMGDSVQCTRPLDHSMLVVGYDTDPVTGEDYWLLKNSWGASWGEGGYLRLKRHQTDRDGQAGLATFPGYAYKNEPNPGQMRKLSIRGSAQALVDSWNEWTAWLGSY